MQDTACERPEQWACWTPSHDTPENVNETDPLDPVNDDILCELNVSDHFLGGSTFSHGMVPLDMSIWEPLTPPYLSQRQWLHPSETPTQDFDNHNRSRLDFGVPAPFLAETWFVEQRLPITACPKSQSSAELQATFSSLSPLSLDEPWNIAPDNSDVLRNMSNDGYDDSNPNISPLSQYKGGLTCMACSIPLALDPTWLTQSEVKETPSMIFKPDSVIVSSGTAVELPTPPYIETPSNISSPAAPVPLKQQHPVTRHATRPHITKSSFLCPFPSCTRKFTRKGELT